MRPSITRTILATALAMLAAVPASAATLGELAREAIVSQCPDLLSYVGELADEPGIVERGYTFVQTVDHPRAGTVDQVRLTREDGEIIISNARDTSFCQVAFSGDGARAVFDRLLADPSAIHEGLRPDIAQVTVPPMLGGLQPVTLRTDTFDGQYLGVQFVDLGPIDAATPLMIQQYVLEE